MKVKAKAKINLTLNIVEKRPDGYHNVDMIMQTLDFGDIVYVDKTLSGIELTGTGSLNYDETNLAFKAAKLFFDVTGIRGGAKIHIQKNIPMCAGMAGGSADAAAVLKALNLLCGKPLSQKRLASVSKRLGADVPYCIRGGTVRALGIGDKLIKLAPLGKVKTVVVKPPVAVSTAEAYGSLNLDSLYHPDTEKAADAILKGDRKTLYSLMGNSFEDSIFTIHPVLSEIKDTLISLGADVSLMSGSGSAIFALFEDEEKALKAYEYFKDKYDEVFLTETTGE